MFDVRFTADLITEESAAEGMVAESGWVSPNSMRSIISIKEDVEPESFDTLEEAVDYIQSMIGSVSDAGGGSYYAEDSSIDYINGDHWNYAAHVTERS